MAEIKECIGKKVKIGKNSITIKTDDGKTCGVVRNIVSLADLQANKQFEYYSKFRKMGLHGKIDIKECIIKDNVLYVFRNMKSKMFHEQYGYFSEYEKKTAEEKEEMYNTIKNMGIDVIECVFA